MMLFDFEKDFAGSLRCIPMIARMKLDLCGVKLTLRQWSQLSHAERTELVDMPCPSAEGSKAYRERVLALIEERADEAARFLPPENHDGWRHTNAMPDAVRLQADADAISPPTPEQWAVLSPLQRFALIKLARSKHENENFVPAMKEFGLPT